MIDTFTNTATTGNLPRVKIQDLLNIMRNLPKPPTLYAIDYEIMFSDYLPNNSIIISKDLAERLGIWK